MAEAPQQAAGVDAHTRAGSPEFISPPPFREAVRTWAYVGLNSFGGPAGQIAVMHRVLVDEKRWISEERFLHALNYCMLLPGPEAQQLATYIGWLLHGARGGLVAGTLFILPGVIVIMLLSYLYAGFQQVTAVQALFFGLKAAVLAIVAEAVLRIGRRALKTRFMAFLAAAAFIAIFFFNIPFPVIIASAALAGFVQRRLTNRISPASLSITTEDSVRYNEPRPSMLRSVQVLGIWCLLWFTPLALIYVLKGPQNVYFSVGAFFSKAAVVTFGGAYEVPPIFWTVVK